MSDYKSEFPLNEHIVDFLQFEIRVPFFFISILRDMRYLLVVAFVFVGVLSYVNLFFRVSECGWGSRKV